jgi:hypothetical protein
MASGYDRALSGMNTDYLVVVAANVYDSLQSRRSRLPGRVCARGSQARYALEDAPFPVMPC